MKSKLEGKLYYNIADNGVTFFEDKELAQFDYYNNPDATNDSYVVVDDIVTREKYLCNLIFTHSEDVRYFVHVFYPDGLPDLDFCFYTNKTTNSNYLKVLYKNKLIYSCLADNPDVLYYENLYNQYRR